MIKDIKKLGFKKLNELHVIKPPKCDCCNEDKSIVINGDGDELEIAEVGLDILSNYNMDSSAALIMRNNDTSLGLIPTRVFEEDKDSITLIEFNQNGKFKNNYEYAVIDDFVSIVNDHGINTILLLEQDIEDQYIYNVRY